MKNIFIATFTMVVINFSTILEASTCSVLNLSVCNEEEICSKSNTGQGKAGVNKFDLEASRRNLDCKSFKISKVPDYDIEATCTYYNISKGLNEEVCLSFEQDYKKRIEKIWDLLADKQKERCIVNASISSYFEDYSCLRSEKMKQISEFNNKIIDNEVHTACMRNYETDKINTLLNQNCISAFRKLGHPNLQGIISQFE